MRNRAIEKKKFHIATGFDGLGGYQDEVRKFKKKILSSLDLETTVIKSSCVK